MLDGTDTPEFVDPLVCEALSTRLGRGIHAASTRPAQRVFAELGEPQERGHQRPLVGSLPRIARATARVGAARSSRLLAGRRESRIFVVRALLAPDSPNRRGRGVTPLEFKQLSAGRISKLRRGSRRGR